MAEIFTVKVLRLLQLLMKLKMYFPPYLPNWWKYVRKCENKNDSKSLKKSESAL